jgi:hypothetical protein
MRNPRPFNLDAAIPRSIRDHCRALEDGGIDVNYERGLDHSLRSSSNMLGNFSKQLPPLSSTASFSPALARLLRGVDGAMRQPNFHQIAHCFHFCAEIRRSGVKVFRPSLQQCVALEHVAIDLKLAEYRQPYPAIIVEYPHDYAAMRQIKFPFSICYHGNEMLMVWRRHDELMDDTLVSSIKDRTIEDALGTRLEGSFCELPCKEATRAAINCCLILSNYPIETHNLLRADLVRANRERARRDGRHYLPPQELTLIQHIDFHEESSEPEHPTGLQLGDSRHRSKAHWRKGHWRRQPVGPGRQQMKLIFIKPILVNARFSTADPEMRQAIYQG